MIRVFMFFWVYFALMTSSTYAQEPDEDPEMALLPHGEGRDEVFYLCSACHSIKTVVQQKLSREKWDEMLDYMVAEQGMSELEAVDRQRILDYLATHVSIEKSP